MKLWEKGYRVLKEVERFTVGNDRELDNRLIGYDILASIAHAACLKKAGILTGGEFARCRSTLCKAHGLYRQRRFSVRGKDEDMHTRIEEFMIERLGALGKKIHTGRSRNDQVLTALRLYQKEKLLETIGAASRLARDLAAFAGRHQRVPMPGYTHMRKAMATTVGHWAAAHGESLLESVRMMESTADLVDSCPLGSASGYGVNLALDRDLSARLLGFRRVQGNSLAVQNSRGKFDAIVLSALANVMIDLNRLAADLTLFSMTEFGFFLLPRELCTGSSLMPQKKNPDVLELIRSNAAVVASLEQRTRGILQGLISGYNRDVQLTKEPLIRGFEAALGSLEMMALVVGRLKVDAERCRAACTDELFATDVAVDLARNGVPFREAYRRVADAKCRIADARPTGSSGRREGPMPQNDDGIGGRFDPLRIALARKPAGSPGNLGLTAVVRDIRRSEVAASRSLAALRTSFRRLLGE